MYSRTFCLVQQMSNILSSAVSLVLCFYRQDFWCTDKNTGVIGAALTYVIMHILAICRRICIVFVLNLILFNSCFDFFDFPQLYIYTYEENQRNRSLQTDEIAEHSAVCTLPCVKLGVRPSVKLYTLCMLCPVLMLIEL